MKLFLVIAISLISANYALSPPLAEVGMVPDYALDDHNELEEIELEMDGDYINMNIDSNQGQNKDLKEQDIAFNIIADDKSRSVDIQVENFPSVSIPEGIESQTFTYTADRGIVVTIEGVHHYDHHHQADKHTTKSVPFLHNGRKPHYTLPVESNPTI